MTWMVLGPTKWRPDHAPPSLTVDDVEPNLPGDWSSHDPPRPIDMRAAAQGKIQENGLDAVLMEDYTARDEESNTDLFHRIRRDTGVARFLVYWPYGAQRSGLDWELGILTSEIGRGELAPDTVLLLVQEDAASIHTSSGELESHERGHRTTYYNDLVQHGCPFALWRDHAGFLDAVDAWTSP